MEGGQQRVGGIGSGSGWMNRGMWGSTALMESCS